MGKSSGYVLILAGLAVAAYALYPQRQSGSEVAAAQGAAPDEAHAVVPAIKVASDGSATADKPAEAAAAPASQTEPKPAPQLNKTDKTDKSEKSGPPVSVVVPPTHLAPPAALPAKRPHTAVAAIEVGGTPPRVPVGDAKTAAPPLDRAALTREIQRNLKRVGCYRGDVTGVWTPSVRQAMLALTERANASLPVDQPDPVLLALVQSHAPGICSAACPQGQDRAANGRCVPSALVSAAVRGGVKTAKAGAGAAKKVPAAGGVTGTITPDGRMSLAGPVAGAPQAKTVHPRRQPKVAGWSRSIPTRPRERRAQPYAGTPSWALPFFFP
jgi:peptidoglycan hydrolase-like protein with peptidoglycan-binding domain